MSGEQFSGHEIFEIFVVGDNIDQRSWTFEIVSPDFEGFEDHEQLLVVYVIVEFWGSETLGVKGDQVNFRVFWRYDGENGSKGVVGGISFKDDLCVCNLMSQYWSGGKGFFEHFEGFSAFWSEIPNNFFSSQTCEWNCDIGVVKNESSVEICKS